MTKTYGGGKRLHDEWVWSQDVNMIYHECLGTPIKSYEWATANRSRSSDDEWVCRRCGAEAPEEVNNICVLLGIDTWKVFE